MTLRITVHDTSTRRSAGTRALSLVSRRRGRAFVPRPRALWSGLVAARLLGSVGGHDVPLGAEGVEALALGAAALAVVTRERVERVLVVGHLRGAVRAPGRAEQPGLGTRARLGRALGQQRRPVLGAGARAGALAPLVLLEQVQRVRLAVDDDPAERAGTGLHGGGLAGRGRGDRGEAGERDCSEREHGQ